MNGYRQRLADATLKTLLASHSAVSITGPRACGKTTTARRAAASFIRLDRPAEAAAFAADPDVALAALAEPALLDEWQERPEVLGAVKRAIDDDPRAGRYVLTGSVRAELDAATWPGTGRVIRLPLWPMTVAEIQGRLAPHLLDRWGRGDFTADTPPARVDLGDYVELAIRGGFPDIALRLTGRARMDWLDSYLEHIITRDARTAGGVRTVTMFRKYVEAVALNTAGQPAAATTADAIGADRRTVAAYEQLLANLLLLDQVPAWSSRRVNRLVKAPKRYLTDPALAVAVLRLDAAGLLRDGDLLGRILDTFVAAQIRPLLLGSASRPRLYHVREAGGAHELDLLLEYAGQHVVGIEIKATATPARRDVRHVEWLRDRLGERFIGGVLLHTGLVTTTLADRIYALPISALWA